MKRPIPSVPPGTDTALRPVLQALKENQEARMGMRGTRVDELPATATTADIIAKVNELIRLLQG